MQHGKAPSVTHNKRKHFYYLPPTQCVNVVVLYITQVAHYVWNKTDFDAVDPEKTDYLMGEFKKKIYIYMLPFSSLMYVNRVAFSSHTKPVVSLVHLPAYSFHLV